MRKVPNNSNGMLLTQSVSIPCSDTPLLKSEDHTGHAIAAMLKRIAEDSAGRPSTKNPKIIPRHVKNKSFTISVNSVK